MHDYKTRWNDLSNNTWLVMNEEKDGWEFMQVIDSSLGEGYDYWFRRKMIAKVTAPIGPGYSQVVC